MFKLGLSKQSCALAVGLTAIAFLLASHGHALADAASQTINIEGTSSTSGGAAGTTLGAFFQNSCTNTVPIIKFLSYVAWCAGLLFTVLGIHHLRMHADAPANHPISKALMLWLGAALLLTAPAFLITISNSLGYPVAASMATCQPPGTTPASASGTGLDVMLSNFVGNIQAPLIAWVQVIANVVGIFFMVNGLIKASKYGYDPKTNSVHSILTNIGFGAILFTIGGNFSMMMSSVFGSSSISNSSAISWTNLTSLTGSGGGSQFQTAVEAGLTFVQIIGFIAFVRGWMVMKKVVEGGGNVTLAQGVTHILGGICAINIYAFLKAMDTTFGTGLL